MHNGLTEKQAGDLLNKFGLNTIKARQKSTLLNKFIEQFKSFLPILLIIAAVLSLVIGEMVDGLLILSIIVLNSLFGIYQEYKAEEAIEALQKLTISTIRVIRNGEEKEIDSALLVPGDVFYLEEGVKIPADARLYQTINLEINEASLTGESIPLLKTKGEMIYMGTIVSKGRGFAEVTHTGMQTKFGQIADKLMSVEDDLTPLQKKLALVSEIIGIVGIITSVIVFGLSIVQGSSYYSSFLLAISLAVAVVPESLPAVMTVILSIGVKRMAQKKAIVRKLASIEALGSTTLIATDKTGTLTENKMTVKEIWIQGKYIRTIGDNSDLKDNPLLESLLLNGVVCSTASLVKTHDNANNNQILGDPTEGALLLLAQKYNYDIDFVRNQWTLLHEIPFDSDTKRMSVVVQKEKGSPILFVKGAPESIIQISTHIQTHSGLEVLTEQRQKDIYTVVEDWAKQGYRVLAFGKKSGELNKNRVEEVSFIGMVAIYDPPRKEAKDAIEKATKAGIKIVMITGDNEVTAEKIGTDVGLVKKGDIIIKGDQIDNYSDKELLSLLPHVKIFARTNPLHKSRIVALYQSLGEVVVVTGDGVNDAIALKQADVGVAMGIVGTDVARETADMVITDDNFATIVGAIEEGRNIIIRLRNSIRYLLTGNLSEALCLVVTLLLGFPPIFLPIQLLYINLISDGLPAIALAFTPSSPKTMEQSPTKKLSLFTVDDYKYIGVVAIGIMSIVILCFIYSSQNIVAQRTIAFTIMAMIQAFIFVDIWLSPLSKKQQTQSYFSPMFYMTLLVPLILQMAITYIFTFASIFRIQKLSFVEFSLYLVVAFCILLYIYTLRFFKILSSKIN